MGKIIAEFPHKYIAKGYLGEIWRPYALCEMKVKGRDDVWAPITMIVDTGADYTLLPFIYADVLGIDLVKDCTAEKTFGIGGKETVYLYKGLDIKIANCRKTVPVGFLKKTDIPPLLGRLGFLETIKVVFHNRATVFEV